MHKRVRLNGLASLILAASCWTLCAGASHAECPNNAPTVGLVMRISGDAKRVRVHRQGDQPFRPITLEKLCAGDVVTAEGEGVTVRIRLADSSELTRRSPFRQVVPNRSSNALGGFAENTWSTLMDHVLPRLRRHELFAVSRAPGFVGWGAAGLAERAAVIAPGVRPIVVVWYGDAGRYRVVLADANGAAIESIQTNATRVRFASRRWGSGAYILQVYEQDTAEPILEGGFAVSDAQPGDGASAPDWAGAEIRAATEAIRLVEIDAQRWSFEALQILETAPQEGLDREPVYALIAQSTP